jgi:hypothetical protein
MYEPRPQLGSDTPKKTASGSTSLAPFIRGSEETVEKDTIQPGYLVRVRENGGGAEGSSVSRWVTLANSADEAREKVAPYLKSRQEFDTSEPPTPLPLETLRRLELGLGEVRRLSHSTPNPTGRKD